MRIAHPAWAGLSALAISLLGATGVLPAAVRSAEIRAASGPQDLGSRINGGQSCQVGTCAITGGTPAGSNLFHRFAVFDTRGGIDGVSLESHGFKSVMVGVTSPLGSFIDKPLILTSPAQLVWLSPGGIQVSGSGTFLNVQQLNLSTATGLRVGSGLFDAITTTATQARDLTGLSGVAITEQATLGTLGLLGNGDLSIDGGLLTVDRSLLVDAQGGHLLLQGARLQAPGASVVLAGSHIKLQDALLDVNLPGAQAGSIVVQATHNNHLLGQSLLSAEGERGGSIDMLGSEVWLAGRSTLKASGRLGGGQIRIGGDELGANPALINAWQTTLSPEVVVQANATQAGHGGRIIVWSDHSTQMLATLEARGAGLSGHGGFIETSGKQSLAIGSIAPDASSFLGSAGTWLMDPAGVVVQESGGNVLTDLPQPEGVGRLDGQYSLDPFVIESAINHGTNVALKSSGDVAILDQLAFSVGSLGGAPLAEFAVDAGGEIRIDAPILTNTGRLNLLLESDFGVQINQNIATNGGRLDVFTSGDITIGAQLSVLPASLDAVGPVEGVRLIATSIANREAEGPVGGINAGSGSVMLKSFYDTTLTIPVVAGQFAAKSDQGDVTITNLQAGVNVGSDSLPLLWIPSTTGAPEYSFAGDHGYLYGIEAPSGRFQVTVSGDIEFVNDASLDAGSLSAGLFVNDSSLATLAGGQIRVSEGSRVALASNPIDGNRLFIGSPVSNFGHLDLLAGEISFQTRLVNEATGQIRIGTNARLTHSGEAEFSLRNQSILAGTGVLGSAGGGILLQGSGAIVSPGSGDGSGIAGTLRFENMLWVIEDGSILRFELGPSGSVLDADAITLVDSGISLVSSFAGGDGDSPPPMGPVVQMGLVQAAAPPGPAPLSFSLISSYRSYDAPFGKDKPDGGGGDGLGAFGVGRLPIGGGVLPGLEIPDEVVSSAFTPVLSAVNANKILSGGILGDFRIGSLIFDYQGQSSIPSGSASPLPAASTQSPVSSPLLLSSRLDQPIIPPNDIKPWLMPERLEATSFAAVQFSVNLSQADFGAVFNLMGLNALVPSNSNSTSQQRGNLATSLVINVEDFDPERAVSAFFGSEQRRSQDIQSTLSIPAGSSESSAILSIPRLREQLDAATNAVRGSKGVSR